MNDLDKQIKEDFKEYLIEVPLKVVSPSGRPSTVPAYTKRVDEIIFDEKQNGVNLFLRFQVLLKNIIRVVVKNKRDQV